MVAVDHAGLVQHGGAGIREVVVDVPHRGGARPLRILELTITHWPWQMAVVGLPIGHRAHERAGVLVRAQCVRVQQPPGSSTAS